MRRGGPSLPLRRSLVCELQLATLVLHGQDFPCMACIAASSRAHHNQNTDLPPINSYILAAHSTAGAVQEPDVMEGAYAPAWRKGKPPGRRISIGAPHALGDMGSMLPPGPLQGLGCVWFFMVGAALWVVVCGLCSTTLCCRGCVHRHAKPLTPVVMLLTSSFIRSTQRPLRRCSTRTVRRARQKCRFCHHHHHRHNARPLLSRRTRKRRSSGGSPVRIQLSPPRARVQGGSAPCLEPT